MGLKRSGFFYGDANLITSVPLKFLKDSLALLSIDIFYSRAVARGVDDKSTAPLKSFFIDLGLYESSKVGSLLANP